MDIIMSIMSFLIIENGADTNWNENANNNTALESR